MGAIIIFPLNPKEETSSSNPRTQKPIVFGVAEEKDYQNLEEILLGNEMIQDLPKSGKLLLSFYNFYSEEREWEKEYVLKKESVEIGQASDYDIRLIMHSKYLTILNSNNFCSVVKLAKSQGDFSSETTLSTTKLIWRYKGMMKYKSCLGL